MGDVIERSKSTDAKERDYPLLSAPRPCSYKCDDPGKRSNCQKDNKSNSNNFPAKRIENRSFRHCGPETHEKHHHQKPLDLLGERMKLFVKVVAPLCRPKR